MHTIKYHRILHTMKRLRCGALILVVMLLPGTAHAQIVEDLPEEAPFSPRIFIQAIQVSGKEFVALKNNSEEELSLGNYRIQYFNDYDVAAASSSKLIDLSEIILPAEATLLLLTEPTFVCEGMVVGSASLGFADKKGLVQVVRETQLVPGGPVSVEVEDAIGWSDEAEPPEEVEKTPESKDQFFWRKITEELDSDLETAPLPFSEWSWQIAKTDEENVCDITLVDNSPINEDEQTEAALPPLTLAPKVEPPATILPKTTQVVAAKTTAKKPVYPARSIGLTAPQITELLPNPGPPLTDADDEFIELYNSNDKIFELSGFKLEVGSTSKRTYTFPQGTLLKPKSFTAFYSTDISVSLANTKSQVRLLDPFGNMISEAEVYEKAKDNLAWALASGKWYWTTTVTPGAANVISEPAATVKAASTSKAKAVSATSSGGSTTNGSGAGSIAPDPLPEENNNDSLHPIVLAGVGMLALGYALYEYRQDIAHRINQFRQYRADRRSHRTSAQG